MKDKKGYYAILNLDDTATEKEIKEAFRQKVKLYHPDKNPDPQANAIYLKINEAYQVLTDPDAKKAYDNLQSDAVDFMPCCQCGRHAHQPRFVFFDVGDSASHGGVFCRSCASRQQFKNALQLWKTFFLSPAKNWNLLKKLRTLQDMPVEKNFEMLMQNASAFNSERRYGLAKFLAEQARRFAAEPPERSKINMFLNVLPEASSHHEEDFWKIGKKDTLRVYMPLLAAILVAFLAFSVPYLPPILSDGGYRIADYEYQNVVPLAFSRTDESRLYHTKKESVQAYQAPSLKSGVLSTLPIQTTVRLTGYVPKSPWVQVMTHEGLIVYLLDSTLEKGIGKGFQPYNSKILPLKE